MMSTHKKRDADLTAQSNMRSWEQDLVAQIFFVRQRVFSQVVEREYVTAVQAQKLTLCVCCRCCAHPSHLFLA
jgi:hypothetical protein